MTDAPDGLVTITMSADALNDLRTATLERVWAEQSEAEKLGAKKLKRLAAHAGGMSQRYMHAIQSLDHALTEAVEF